jgi:ribosomal protein S14
MWEAADDLDKLLHDVWCMALDASRAKDQQEEIHDCSVCGDPHGTLDESKYLDMQRANLNYARRELDAILAKERTP